MSRVVVSIHGTGRTEHTFWIPQVQALAEHLGNVPPHQPVWFGDLIDAGARISRIGTHASNLTHTLAQCLRGRPSQHVARIVLNVADFLHRFVNGVDGVIAYFISSHRAKIIRERLRRTLAELSSRGDEIVLISESLGCLVAFDVLREHANEYNLVAWITLGCALKMIVNGKQRTADLGAINPQTVKQWLNIYAPRDLVATPIAPVFPGYPIRDLPVDGGRGRLNAHRYWSNPRVTEMIARVMQGDFSLRSK